MINVTPYKLKEERRYGRLNKFLVKQVFALSVIGVVAVGFMLFGLVITNEDEKRIEGEISRKQALLEPLKEFEEEAKELNQDVKTIETLFDKEVLFSELLVDVASSIPNGVRLTGLTLTGDRTQPLQISAEMNTQSQAAIMRKSLVDSGIFSSADILNIQPESLSDDGTFNPATASFSATLAGADIPVQTFNPTTPGGPAEAAPSTNQSGSAQ